MKHSLLFKGEILRWCMVIVVIAFSCAIALIPQNALASEVDSAPSVEASIHVSNANVDVVKVTTLVENAKDVPGVGKLESGNSSAGDSPISSADAEEANPIVDNDAKAESSDKSSSGTSSSGSASGSSDDTQKSVVSANDGVAQTPAVTDQIIKDGTYVIETGVSDSQVLDVAGGNTSNGANVQIYQYNGTGAQQWRVSYDSESGYYAIVNVASGKALDISGASTSDGANVQIYQSNGTKAQLWKILKGASGYTLMSALKEGFVLDIAGAGSANGTNAQAYASNGTPAQKFWFLPWSAQMDPGKQTVADGCYSIVLSADDRKVLDISAGSASNGANVQVYASNGTMAQKFQIVYGADGFYTILNVGSGLALDVCGAGIMPGTNVWQYASNGTAAQKWIIVDNGNGTFTFVSRINGLALDILGGSVADGANVQVYRANGTKAQQFLLRAAEYLNDGLYTIAAVLDSDKVLDVTNASLDDVQLQLYDYNGSLAQKFTAMRVDTGVYTLQSAGSLKYLTALDGKLVQASDLAGDTQKWQVVWDGTGFRLCNVSTNAVISLSDAKVANGEKVVLVNSASSAYQLFCFRIANIIDVGYYTISSAVGDKVLDISAGGRKNGSNVQIYSPNGTGAQKYYIEQIGDLYRITSAQSGRVLDVVGGSTADFSNVQIYSYNGTNAQLWSVKLAGGNRVYFVNQGSGKALDVRGGSNSNGANVDIYTMNYSDAQKWGFSRTTYTPENVVVLDVPCWWNQYDVGLPTGCESMALTNALLYWGFSLEPSTIADNYMPWSDSDFVYSFLGNPHSYSGGAILAPGLTNTANNFLSAAGSLLGAYEITGTSFYDLYNYIRQGIPVIVWNTVDLSLPGESWTSDGYTLFSGTHTVVLSGFDLDAGTICVSDSISGNVWRDAGAFEWIYSCMGSQAIVIT